MINPCLTTKADKSLVVFIENHCSNIFLEIDSTDPKAPLERTKNEEEKASHRSTVTTARASDYRTDPFMARC